MIKVLTFLMLSSVAFSAIEFLDFSAERELRRVRTSVPTWQKSLMKICKSRPLNGKIRIKCNKRKIWFRKRRTAMNKCRKRPRKFGIRWRCFKSTVRRFSKSWPVKPFPSIRVAVRICRRSPKGKICPLRFTTRDFKCQRTQNGKPRIRCYARKYCKSLRNRTRRNKCLRTNVYRKLLESSDELEF